MSQIVVCDAGCASGPGVLYPTIFGVKPHNIVAYDADSNLVTTGIHRYSEADTASLPGDLRQILPDSESFKKAFVMEAVDMDTCM